MSQDMYKGEMIQTYLDRWIGGIVENLYDDPIRRPCQPARCADGKLVHLHMCPNQKETVSIIRTKAVSITRCVAVRCTASDCGHTSRSLYMGIWTSTMG